MINCLFKHDGHTHRETHKGSSFVEMALSSQISAMSWNWSKTECSGKSKVKGEQNGDIIPPERHILPVVNRFTSQIREKWEKPILKDWRQKVHLDTLQTGGIRSEKMPKGLYISLRIYLCHD